MFGATEPTAARLAAETDPASINQAMASPPQLSEAELEAATDPAELLARAWVLEPPMRMDERVAALDRLEQLLAGGAPVPVPPAGRSWRLELMAERALDASMTIAAASSANLRHATQLAEAVVAEADPDFPLAAARAILARGRSIAWTGTDEATRQADRILIDAEQRFAALADPAPPHDFPREWQAFTMFWRGQTIYFQNGHIVRAAELMASALALAGPDSPRRPTILSFYADALTMLGRWDEADAALTEADTLAERHDDLKSRSYNSWSRAIIASGRGDALATERHLREAEREAGPWFETHNGLTFLTDAVELLDRVGLSAQAHAYLARAAERVPEDESIQQARATMVARSGNPWQAIEALQQLARGDWLEKRLIWRNTLLTAWATFRAGREGAGELAARALEQAIANGGISVALAGERELTLALAPLAEQAGAASARELLLGPERRLLIRLFGTPRVTAADGSGVELPAGKPGELVRMLAVNDHGLPVDVVLDTFFPDASASAGRQRLRQVLTRLRAVAGDLVVRDGDHLRLAPAWVDVSEFLSITNRVRTTRGPRSVRLAYAALALRSGPLLPTDRYAGWADQVRDQVEYRHLAMLDLIAADAAARGSHQEALTALDAALVEDPDDRARHAAIAEQLTALGRHGAAEYLTRTGEAGTGRGAVRPGA